MVWGKGIIIPGIDPNIRRRDELGSVIAKIQYGNRGSSEGWEIDHIIPTSEGGTDIMSNLRPLHWRNNVQKSDNTL